ncbi:MAG TPA: DUF2065 domain-containing protein [Alphaproteobacteria bacterium]|jgi:uncharacterized protein YjeT (DUF2065 family)
MSELLVALALILVIEGALYALFPGRMKRMMAEVLRLPDETLRNVGLIAAAVGLGMVWLLLR